MINWINNFKSLNAYISAATATKTVTKVLTYENLEDANNALKNTEKIQENIIINQSYYYYKLMKKMVDNPELMKKLILECGYYTRDQEMKIEEKKTSTGVHVITTNSKAKVKKINKELSEDNIKHFNTSHGAFKKNFDELAKEEEKMFKEITVDKAKENISNIFKTFYTSFLVGNNADQMYFLRIADSTNAHFCKDMHTDSDILENAIKKQYTSGTKIEDAEKISIKESTGHYLTIAIADLDNPNFSLFPKNPNRTIPIGLFLLFPCNISYNYLGISHKKKAEEIESKDIEGAIILRTNGNNFSWNVLNNYIQSNIKASIKDFSSNMVTLNYLLNGHLTIKNNKYVYYNEEIKCNITKIERDVATEFTGYIQSTNNKIFIKKSDGALAAYGDDIAGSHKTDNATHIALLQSKNIVDLKATPRNDFKIADGSKNILIPNDRVIQIMSSCTIDEFKGLIDSNLEYTNSFSNQFNTTDKNLNLSAGGGGLFNALSIAGLITALFSILGNVLQFMQSGNNKPKRKKR